MNAWGRTRGAEPPKRRVPGMRLLLTAGLALTTSVMIAACGGGGVESGGGSSASVETVTVSGKPSGDLTISNWPLYIDKQTVPDFEKATGVQVKYIEDVNDNQEFFSKLQPSLAKGESGGRSIVVVTDWMAKKMYDLGYVQNLDKAAIPNVEKNITANLRNRPFDPNNDFAVPWQSGMTGLIVRTDLAPQIKSICDLFNSKYKGKVDMLTEMRDTVPLVMKCQGVDLNKATEDDWLSAIDKLKQAADDGQIRRFTGNDYARDLTSGDVDAVIGWSGDAIQLQADNPDIKFVMPDEGCMLWFDDMVIPVGAPNPTAAYAWMNYVYEPKNHAQIADYNYYFTPVDGVKPILAKQGSDAAKSQLVFPSQKYIADCTTQDNPQGGPEVEQRIERAWQAVVTG